MLIFAGDPGKMKLLLLAEQHLKVQSLSPQHRKFCGDVVGSLRLVRLTKVLYHNN